MLIGYRFLHASATAPRHAFGAGFGYARFTMTDLSLDGSMSRGASVAMTVTNISDRAGSEVVQLYRATPELTLIGFAKVTLPAGESRRVTIELPRRRFETWADGWRLIDAPMQILAGASSAVLTKVEGVLPL